MRGAATARKVREGVRFTDLSDYARPLAARIALGLADKPVIAAAVTALFGPIGLAGAACYALGEYRLALVGAAAMQLKNVLDAVDGSLARLQGRPSRIGRFLDSITDAVVAVALFAALALAVACARPLAYALVLAAAALLSGLLQGSVFNYYFVRYRTRSGGDATSRLHEKVTRYDELYYEDRPFALAVLRALVGAYRVIYGWQDALVRRVDEWAAAPLAEIGRADLADELRDDHRWLTAVSALGPGLQILVLDLYTLAGYRHLELALELFLWTVTLGGAAYAAALLARLRRAASRMRRPAGR